jgi:type I restriction enzyme S subunit
MSWEEKQLEKLTLYVKRGVSPKYVLGNGIPIVNQRCIRENTINFDIARLSSKEKKITDVKFLQIGDTVINSTGVGTLGRSAYVKNLEQSSSVDTHVTIVRPDKTKVDSKFLSLYINSKEDVIENMGKGATGQTELSAKDLSELNVFYPKSLQTQKRIADILSAYDDLIENNLKRIKLLEQAAQNIYKEWFVNLRFPGHENTHINEETELPMGWEEKTLGEFTEIKKGKNITKSTIIDGNVPVVAGGLKPAYYHNTSNTINPVITVSASGANAGYVNIYLEDIWASDCSYIDSNLSDSVFFIHNLLLNQQELIYGMQRGAAQPHVYPKDLKRAEFVIPAKGLIQKFEEQVSAQYDMKRVLLNQNQKLKAAQRHSISLA